MAPKIVDREQKRAEIMNAAIQVFAQNGIVKSKMIDIARKAGVGKGTIYEYFRSKEEIFAACYSQFSRQWEEKIQDALSQTDDPEAQLRALITVSVEGAMQYNEDFLGIMMDFWAEGIRSKNEDMLRIIDLKNLYTEFRALVAGIIQKGTERGVFRAVDAKSYASALIGALDGVMLQMIIDPQLLKWQEVGQALIDAFLNGIKT